MKHDTPAPMTVYDWFDGPYPARVRIAIAEKNWNRRSASNR